MYRKMVRMYEGERVLGDVELHPQNGVVWVGQLNEIRISHFSPPSERCPPLSVLHTISSTGICFKLEATAKNQDSPLSLLHASCLRDNKTAVASIGGREIHLVAMHSRRYEGRSTCFWGFNVASSLYNSCLIMLNLRCLGIVFDLDETLIVANTMRSFEDRIEALQRKINSESDPQRISGMWAEIKRYHEDKNILKQYAESDQVIDNGKVIKSQSEVVPALSETHQPIVRPLIRLQDRNIILTRISPLIRDTSVLVRLRPAWEDLRSYLTARGRKRFEVFVCTMAERDYALEMWRLLDPESNLINSRELLERIVCVKSGSKKSLFNVFQNGNSHPKMALVIDDRLKVWDEKDQSRVHVVPAFAPYYAPQAEANNAIPVLCVARNVACNVRGGFFKDFDAGMLQRISEVAYEDDIKEVLSSPDVSNYLVSEDDPSASNGNKDSIGFDGMADSEVERRLKEAISASSTAPTPIANLDSRISEALLYAVSTSSFTVPQPTIQWPGTSFPSQQLPQVNTLLKQPIAQIGQGETTIHSSPAREEGEVPESELDPDTRRRLLILQHGQDMRESVPARPAMQVSVPRAQSHGWNPIEEEMSQVNHMAPPKEFTLNAESLPIDKNQVPHPSFLHKMESALTPARALLESRRLLKEAPPGEDQLRFNQSMPSFNLFSGEDASVARPSSANKDLDLEAGQIDPYNEPWTVVLQDIAFKCGTKVEFKQALRFSTELQFAVEVLFAGERIGEGVGRTRREAQQQAAEGSLLYLAEIVEPNPLTSIKAGSNLYYLRGITDKYLSQHRPHSSHVPGEGSRFANQKENGFITDANSFGHQSLPKEEGVPFPTSAASPRFSARIEASKKPMGSIAALKELCMKEGFNVTFQTQPQFSSNPGQKNEVYAEVDINGRVMGKGIGLTWDEANAQAAEKALVALKFMIGKLPYEHQDSPRLVQGGPNKRLKQDYSRVPLRMASSDRYPRNGSPAP